MRDERTDQMIERAVRWYDWAEGHTEHTGTGPCACAFEEKSKTTEANLTLTGSRDGQKVTRV